MDRLSDRRFMANYFRLYLHAAAMNLLVRLRRFVAEPLPVLALQAETASPTSQPGEAVLATEGARVPAEPMDLASIRNASRRENHSASFYGDMGDAEEPTALSGWLAAARTAQLP